MLMIRENDKRWQSLWWWRCNAPCIFICSSFERMFTLLTDWMEWRNALILRSKNPRMKKQKLQKVKTSNAVVTYSLSKQQRQRQYISSSARIPFNIWGWNKDGKTVVKRFSRVYAPDNMCIWERILAHTHTHLIRHDEWYRLLVQPKETVC